MAQRMSFSAHCGGVGHPPPSPAEATTAPCVRPILRSPPDPGQWSMDTPTSILPSATAVASADTHPSLPSEPAKDLASKLSRTVCIKGAPIDGCGPLLREWIDRNRVRVLRVRCVAKNIDDRGCFATAIVELSTPEEAEQLIEKEEVD